jgi:hypothetical protein
MTNEERARAVIKKISYITIATVSDDGMPWNAPVFAAYDENTIFIGAHIVIAKNRKISGTTCIFGNL